MKVCIGILAYQEEANIGSLLESIGGQTLLASPGHQVTIHVVPNGCRDGTAQAAESGLAKLHSRHPSVAVQINEIIEPGKANAWNRFVHEFSSPETDALLLLDADIRLGQPECLGSVVAALAAHPEAVVAVDTPVKDIALSDQPSARARLSLAASSIQLSGVPKLTGHLYCARADALRRIWMPPGLLVEDGFLKAMLLTEGFSQAENIRGIVRAPDATHTFEAVTTLGEWFKHERRIFNGTAVNIALFGFLEKQAAKSGPVGAFIREKNGSDPDWVNTVLRERLQRGIPGGAEFIRTPLAQALRLSGLQKWKAIPVALLRCILNAAVYLVCRDDLKTGRLKW